MAIRSTGESQGVKLGGLLVQMLNSVTIKCKPAEIPEFLEIDVTDMEMNTNLFVKDITLPEDVEMITAEDIADVSVQEPKEEKEEEVVEAAEMDEAEVSSSDQEEAQGQESGDSAEGESKDESGDES